MHPQNNRPRLSREEIARRYPRLIRAMKWAGCLNSSEAECAIDCWRNYRLEWSTEAVNHYGGNIRIIQNAFRLRRCTYRDPRWAWGRLVAA
jgi:hypothetical protein